MRLKWDKNGGTILDDPFLSKALRGADKMSMLISQTSEDEDVLFGDSETSRLADHFGDEEDREGYPSSQSNKLNIYKGILFSAMSSIFFSLSSVIVKYLKNIHPAELALFRFIGIFILSIPLVLYHGEKFLGPPDLRPLLILRGIAGSTSLFLRFCAFRDLPFVDASVIIFTVPIVVTIFACFCLNEPCGLFQALIVALTMIGLCLTMKLPILVEEEGVVLNNIIHNLPNVTHFRNSNHLISPNNMTITVFNHHEERFGLQAFTHSNYFRGVFAGLSSTFFGALVYIFLRKVKAAHHSVIMFNFGLIAIIETGFLTSILNGFSIPSTTEERILVFCLMLFSFLGQILLTKSLQLEQAGPVAIVRAATDIVLAFVWQICFFKQIPDSWSISGACLVVLCIILTSLRKWIFSLPDHSMIKYRLMFVR